MVVKYEHIDTHLLVTSSAWSNASQAAVDGVGFILNSFAEKSLCEVVSLNKRILNKVSLAVQNLLFSLFTPPQLLKTTKKSLLNFTIFFARQVMILQLTTPWPYLVIGMPNLAMSMSDIGMTSGQRIME